MKRPHYKDLYLREKMLKDVYKDTFETTVEQLKKFDNIFVMDKEEIIPHIRTIEIRQNDKYIQFAISLDLLESEVN